MATRVGPFELIRALPSWGSGWHFARHVGDPDDELPARAVVRAPLVGEGPFLAAEGGARVRAQRPRCPFLPNLLRTLIEPSGVCLVFEPTVAIRIDALMDDPLPPAIALGYVDEVAAALIALERGRALEKGVLQLSFDELLIQKHGDALVLTAPVGMRATTPGLLQQPRLDRFLFPPEKLANEASLTQEIYMLGALLFMMLTGKEPTGDAPSMRAIDRDIPDSLDAIVRRAMSRDADERHESVDELRAELARALDRFPFEDRAEFVRARAGHLLDEAEGLLR